jgi:hypothetical protein
LELKRWAQIERLFHTALHREPGGDGSKEAGKLKKETLPSPPTKEPAS